MINCVEFAALKTWQYQYELHTVKNLHEYFRGFLMS
jgi:hypothetical protein